MFASPEIRAKRRLKQVKKSSKKANFNYILKQIKARDMRDMTRNVAPGLPAADCHLIDNTNYDIPQTFNTILKIIRAKK